MLHFIFLLSFSGHHSVPQTNVVRREQEGNGGLDQRAQIRPEMGNLRGLLSPSLSYFKHCYLLRWLPQIYDGRAKCMIL